MSNKGLGSMSEIRGQRLDFGHTHLKMSWIHHQISHRDGVVGYPPPPFHTEPPPPSSSSGTKISPAVLFIIVILSVLFFISGVLHLLVRFLMKRQPSSSSQPNDRYPEVSASEALERQLQQLFHLHDSGLDQAFIDALPLFMYKEIKGAKEPFDCAVCLCEFTEKDQLRLLPSCSHAFHLNCIDTWLLSNSTCPLCRAALYNPGMSIENPVFDFDHDMREEDGLPSNGNNGFVPAQKTVEIEEVVTKKGVFPVRLGKFRKLDSSTGETDVGETSSSNLDARRCFSMGSYQYVVGDAKLRVTWKNERGGFDPKTVKEAGNISTSAAEGDLEGKKISIGSRTDSYSVSKIWLWSKKGKFASSSEAQ